MAGKRYLGLISCILSAALLLNACGSGAGKDAMQNDAGGSEAETNESAAEAQADGEAESEESDQDEMMADYFGDERYSLSAAIAEGADILETEDDVEAQEVFKELERINGDNLFYCTDNYGCITYLEGSIFEGPCDSREALQSAIDKLLPALTTDNSMELSAGEMFLDDHGNYFVSYHEILDGAPNPSNVVKIFFDENMNMMGLSSSMFPNINDDEMLVSRDEALLITKDATRELFPEKNFRFYENETTFGYNLISDPVTGQEYNCKIYTVISDNPDADTASIESAYLEHLVTMGGVYLWSRPAKASIARNNSEHRDVINKWINRSTAKTYTTVIDDINGKKQEITVPVAYDKGMYFLEDVDRNIICADYWEFEFNNDIRVISSKTNNDWDEDYIIAYYNYITAYDYYASDGWDGPDGLGAPMILLMDYCDENHTPIDNLCYLGQYEQAHLFTATSKGNNYHRLLDLIAHEYTHSVTTTILGNIVYKNEQGSINEAMSDIMGELTELCHYEKIGNPIDPNRTFLMGGDGTIAAFRDIFDPEIFGQPSCVGGVFYVPPVAIPSSMNDRGGVHVNSGIVSHLLYTMSADTGLSYEDLSEIWEAVICMLVPGTNFTELSYMITMACHLTGYDDYIDIVEQCIEESGLRLDDPFAGEVEGTSNFYMDLPPWINWDRTRLDLVDEIGDLHCCWPARGSNRINVTVYPGNYTIQLTEFDSNQTPIDGWYYDGMSWGDYSNKDKKIYIGPNIIYKLSDIELTSVEQQ
jgi:Zn-dependent metalloprotease